MKKIVFVGAPASGKTSVLNILSKALCDNYRGQALFVSEAAREIIDSTPPAVLSEMTSLVFQYEVYKLQIEKERKAEAQGYNFIFCDRGIADAFIYLSESEARTFLGDTSEKDVASMYSTAVLLKGSQTNYISDNSKRKESSYSEIEALEEKTFKFWEKYHNNLITVHQAESVRKKAYDAAVALNLELNANIFDLNAIAETRQSVAEAELVTNRSFRRQ